jgi:arylsulfatase A-like enzyme
MWFAGGGIKSGQTIGESDEFGFNVVSDKVHVHDLHATILHLLGFDHEKLSVRAQGLDFRLTGVAGEVVKSLLA